MANDLLGTVNHDEFSQRGWVPKTDEANKIHERSGQGSVFDERGGQGKALVSVEETIYSHAVGIDSDNCAIRQWSGLQEHRKRIADLRTTLRQEAARDIRISLRRDIRRELNAKLPMVKGEQLNRLLAGYFDRGKQTLEMQLPDGPLPTDTRGLLLRVNMVARFCVMITTTWIFKCSVWFDFSVWHSLRLRQVGNRRL